jgi:Leucine-rich repeat (LRR) protein
MSVSSTYLSKDVLFHIFGYVASNPNGICDLAKGRFVCKDWRRTINEYAVIAWKEVTQLPVLESVVTSLKRIKDFDKKSPLFHLNRLQKDYDSLEKIWSCVQKQMTFEGNPPQGALEIYTWLNTPKNQAQINTITKLDLSSLKLRVLTWAISKFPELIELRLTNNDLTRLPNVFNKLPKLSKLDLAQNKLRFLPETFSQLSQLSSLTLNKNKLKVLPETLSQLSQLSSLTLKNNELKALPNIFNQFPLLLNVDISNNRLKFVPETLEGRSQNLAFYDTRGNDLGYV